MIKVIEAEIKRKKYAMVLNHVNQNEDEVDVALEVVKEKRVRGIIFLGGYFNHDEEKLEKLQVPFILSTVGAAPENVDNMQCSSLTVDDEKESYKMISHLIDRGHKRIAILCVEMDEKSVGYRRLLGYRKALRDHGIAVDERLIREMSGKQEAYTYENGYEVMRELLQEDQNFTAICYFGYHGDGRLPGDHRCREKGAGRYSGGGIRWHCGGGLFYSADHDDTPAGGGDRPDYHKTDV